MLGDLAELSFDALRDSEVNVVRRITCIFEAFSCMLLIFIVFMLTFSLVAFYIGKS